MATCSIVNCGRETVARGWCQKHYYTWKRTGDVLGLRVTCARCGDERYHEGRGGPHRLCPECRGKYSICGICKEILPIDRFGTHRGKPVNRCRLCNAEYAKQLPPSPPYKKSSEQIRRSNLKRLYGMSPEEYAGRVADQQGCCAICGDLVEKLVVDHCHRKGSVRKLLCGACNWGLGHFRDDPKRLAKAMQYLTEHN